MNEKLEKKKYIKVVVFLIMALVILYLLIDKNRERLVVEEMDEGLDLGDLEALAPAEVEEDIQEDLVVYITGEIKEPGLISIEEGDRLSDVVERSGGLTSQADIDTINLAKRVSDEEKIYIPKIGEEPGPVTGGGTEAKVNINKSSKSELMTLPGVGEATANKIIEFREKEPFKVKEDIMKVGGIGDKKYQDMEDKITTN